MRLHDARAWLISVVGLCLLWLALRGLPLDEIQSSLSGADVRFLGGGAVFFVLSGLFRALRWRLLLPAPSRPRTIKVLACVWAGQLVNLVIPMKAGEVVRALYMSEIVGTSRLYVLSTVAIERAFDSLIVLAMALALAPAVAFPVWFHWSGLGSTAVLAFLLIASAVVARFRRVLTDRLTRLLVRVPILARSGVLRRLEPILGALDAMAEPRVFLAVWGLSCLSWLCGALVNYAVMLSLGLDLGLSVAVFTLLTLTIGVSLPSLPWQIGLFETIAVLSLMAFGVDQATGIAFGVLLHLVSQGFCTLLGAASLQYLEVTRRRRVVPVNADGLADQ